MHVIYWGSDMKSSVIEEQAPPSTSGQTASITIETLLAAPFGVRTSPQIARLRRGFATTPTYLLLVSTDLSVNSSLYIASL